MKNRDDISMLRYIFAVHTNNFGASLNLYSISRILAFNSRKVYAIFIVHFVLSSYTQFLRFLIWHFSSTIACLFEYFMEIRPAYSVCCNGDGEDDNSRGNRIVGWNVFGWVGVCVCVSPTDYTLHQFSSFFFVPLANVNDTIK